MRQLAPVLTFYIGETHLKSSCEQDVPPRLGVGILNRQPLLGITTELLQHHLSQHELFAVGYTDFLS